MNPQKTLRWGIIGGGLMGREMASCMGRWFALQDFPVHCELVAVCDTQAAARDWFGRVPTVQTLTDDIKVLLGDESIDAIYVAVPHNLHESIYRDVLRSGKDLLAEKPFGIDLNAAQNIAEEATQNGRFVRCSSEFPFLPGAQRIWRALSQNAASLGHILEIRAGFHHGSDLDANKPVNWKRQIATCGEPGVMNDLGMHTLHIPLRLGWKPRRVYAQLQKIYETRPDGRGGMAPSDTWDNALLHTDVEIIGPDGIARDVPMRLETKRLAPGEMNTWFIEVLGTDGGFKFSTKHPKTLCSFERNSSGEQSWKQIDIGYDMAFPTITGSIFEAGFPDCLLQMFAAFAAERAGLLNDRLGCVRPEEAVLSHQIWQAALQSQREKRAIEVRQEA